MVRLSALRHYEVVMVVEVRIASGKCVCHSRERQRTIGAQRVRTGHWCAVHRRGRRGPLADGGEFRVLATHIDFGIQRTLGERTENFRSV